MHRWLVFLCASAVPLVCPACLTAAETPQARDPRLAVELFAEHPLVVTPTGLSIADDGRVFVAESHTHFRPEGYDGPSADRILILHDTDGDGRADRHTVFHEGFVHVMDIEFHHDGSLYVATRRDIHRLTDRDGDGKADDVKLVVRLDTPGDYPHNGLSGLAFHFDGTLNFGLGENLGQPYTLIGADGTRLSGGGEGGSTYAVRADGSGLRRTSTGWWNPYGMCVDAFGRVFGTDNDPDASPPCRLIQVIDGGDYGYEFRHGRSGLNPLIGWNGEVPGTLPMISGTGEAPCHIVAYESDAFPQEYLGDLLVPCWADHRLERYRIIQRSDRGLVEAARDVLIEGPDDFRPVGIDVAPDGTVYVSDWVSSSYTLHKLGRVWRIRPAARVPSASIADRGRSDRRIREPMVRAMLPLREVPFGWLQDARLLSLALQAGAPLRATPPQRFPSDAKGSAIANQVLALRHQQWSPAADADNLPFPVRAEGLRCGDVTVAEAQAAQATGDPLLLHAAVEGLSRGLTSATAEDVAGPGGLAILLAARRSEHVREKFARDELAACLQASDPDVRFLAVKWIADDRLTDYRSDLERMLATSDLDYRLFRAVVAALARLEGKPPTDHPPADLLLQKIRDPRAPAAIRRICLRQLPPQTKELRLEDLTSLLDHPDPRLRVEAIRTLAATAFPERSSLLASVARDVQQPTQVRAAAAAGLTMDAAPPIDLLLELAAEESEQLRAEALRGLVGAELTSAQRQMLSPMLGKDPAADGAIRRILDSPTLARPPATDVESWRKLLRPGGDPEAGERIFYGARVGTCGKCHMIDGRGLAVGPDLSAIHRRIAAEGEQGVEWLLKTILQPGQQMAPQYTPWQIITKDGRTLVGLPRRKGGNMEAYLGLDGREFTINKDHIDVSAEMDKSIMPEGLLQSLTEQELSDLLAFLGQPR